MSAPSTLFIERTPIQTLIISTKDLKEENSGLSFHFCEKHFRNAETQTLWNCGLIFLTVFPFNISRRAPSQQSRKVFQCLLFQNYSMKEPPLRN